MAPELEITLGVDSLQTESPGRRREEYFDVLDAGVRLWIEEIPKKMDSPGCLITDFRKTGSECYAVVARGGLVLMEVQSEDRSDDPDVGFFKVREVSFKGTHAEILYRDLKEFMGGLARTPERAIQYWSGRYQTFIDLCD